MSGRRQLCQTAINNRNSFPSDPCYLVAIRCQSRLEFGCRVNIRLKIFSSSLRFAPIEQLPLTVLRPLITRFSSAILQRWLWFLRWAEAARNIKSCIQPYDAIKGGSSIFFLCLIGRDRYFWVLCGDKKGSRAPSIPWRHAFCHAIITLTVYGTPLLILSRKVNKERNCNFLHPDLPLWLNKILLL